MLQNVQRLKTSRTTLAEPGMPLWVDSLQEQSRWPLVKHRESCDAVAPHMQSAPLNLPYCLHTRKATKPTQPGKVSQSCWPWLDESCSKRTYS
eukprot:28885-Amphidinium_carterae.1